MPTTTIRQSPETREMRLFSKVIDQHDTIELLRSDAVTTGSTSLAQFIARRRQPGDGWRTWDELRYELRDVSGEIVSDATVRKWAKRYGIPENTALAGGPVTAREYATAMRKAGIEL